MLVNEVTFVNDEPEEEQPAEPGVPAAGEDARDGDEKPVAPPTDGDEEIVRAKARIAELEEVATTSMDEMASLRQSMVELEGRLSGSTKSLVEAVSRYREMVIQDNPEIPAELISGDSIDSVDESLRNAKSLVGKVRQGLETEVSLGRVPAGAPERRSPELSALSPREKIQYGIGGKKWH